MIAQYINIGNAHEGGTLDIDAIESVDAGYQHHASRQFQLSSPFEQQCHLPQVKNVEVSHTD